jgi:serine/threonine-protein kinase
MSTTDLPGSSLLAGRYRLVERLGAGGMSVVWRGFDEVLGRQVAVKVLPPSTSTDPSFRRRLRAEAQAAARLSHPHITNVYDYGEATTVDGEPVPYVVMELVDGESLAAVLARSRRLPWPVAQRCIASELTALHSACGPTRLTWSTQSRSTAKGGRCSGQATRATCIAWIPNDIPPSSSTRIRRR